MRDSPEPWVRAVCGDPLADGSGETWLRNGDVGVPGVGRDRTPEGRRRVMAGERAVRGDHQRGPRPLQNRDRLAGGEIDALEESLEARPPQLLVGVAPPQGLGTGDWSDR